MLTKWCCHTLSQLTNNISPLGPYLHITNKKSLSWFFAPTHPHNPIPETFTVWYFAFRLYLHIFVFPLIILLTFIYSCLYLDTCHTFLLFADFLRIGKITVPSVIVFFFHYKTFVYKEKSKFFHKDSWSHIYGDLCGQKLSCLQIKSWQFIVSSEETW